MQRTKFGTSKSLAFALVLLNCTSIFAIDLDTAKKALDIISDFSAKICSEIPLKSESKNTELSGKAKAELSGIIKKLADMGIEGAGNFKHSESQGLLQSELATAIKNNSDCKFKVFLELEGKFLKSRSDSIPKGKPGKDSASKQGAGPIFNNQGAQGPIAQSVGQTGGITANIVNQAPKPRLEIVLKKAVWDSVQKVYRRDGEVNIIAPYAVGLVIEAHSPTITDFGIFKFNRFGIGTDMGGCTTGNGFVSRTYDTVIGKYNLSVETKSIDSVSFAYEFQ